MNCPVCNVNLTMTFRENVEIDYCPKCRGVWLDRGEIEKIIEKTVGSAGRRSDDDDDDRRREDRPVSDSSANSQQPYPPRKRKGFLSEILDWD